MAFRFQRRVTLIPGLRLNFGKRGVSVSAGIRGANITAGRRGVHGNMGAPGTGLSYRTRLDKAPAHQRRAARAQERNSNGQTSTSTSSQKVTLECDAQGKLNMVDEFGAPASAKLKRDIWAQHADKIHTFLRNEMERINDDHELLVNIHHDTPPLSTPAPELEQQPFAEPEPRLPMPKTLPSEPTPIKKRFWHTLFATLETRRVSTNEAAYQAWQQELKATQHDNEEQTNKYTAQHAAWSERRNEHNETQQALSEAFNEDLHSDTEFMSGILENELAQLDWPRETNIDFEINQQQIKLDVDLPASDHFPSQEANFNASKKRLLVKNKSATQQRKEYAQHVHGVIFRLLGVVFVTLPSINEIDISAYSQRINEATGHEEDEYLLQVCVKREDWARLNLDTPERINPITALEQFNLQRNMSKTGIFTAIAV
ncbi:MAG: DUF4236 domain-containing protein [Idiomarina sp.]|nr:DUF4236 domain-containing protein [Idiomarina sp.]